MSDFIGAAISATASHINKGIDAIFSHKQNKKEYERQKEFAQNGIRWRVEDAKAAGIHPIYAIGANTPTYSPQAVTGMDLGFSDAGQAFGRAIEAKQTREERYLADLQRENAKLQNDFLRAQINRTNTETMWSELDYVTRQAHLSEAALSTQSDQRPPSMPTTDWKHHVPRGDNMFQWMSGSRPDVYHFMPGNDYSQIFEDKGWLLEKGGLASAAITYLGGRADNETLDGMKYFVEVGGWVPMESKLYRQLMEARHAKSRVDYGPERYRSIRDTPMRNWR